MCVGQLLSKRQSYCASKSVLLENFVLRNQNCSNATGNEVSKVAADN